MWLRRLLEIVGRPLEDHRRGNVRGVGVGEGLVLEETHVADFRAREPRSLPDLVSPVSSFLVPVFFVLMGLRVDLNAVLGAQATGLALLLTVVAIAGKQACALGGLGGGLDAVSIGIGMIPRGEVGLIFASIGLGLTVHGERIVDPITYSAVVLMVMLTTLVTPPALKWSLTRRPAAAAGRVERPGPAIASPLSATAGAPPPHVPTD